jgi:hypothetical protein
LFAFDSDQSHFWNRDLTIESMRTFLSDGCNLLEKNIEPATRQGPSGRLAVAAPLDFQP